VPRTFVAVNRQGRLTLPADIRRHLGIGEGSQLEVRVQDRSRRDMCSSSPRRICFEASTQSDLAMHRPRLGRRGRVSWTRMNIIPSLVVSRPPTYVAAMRSRKTC
jgi:AbrB family looped-hinge helix DNA binding protein